MAAPETSPRSDNNSRQASITLPACRLARATSLGGGTTVRTSRFNREVAMLSVALFYNVSYCFE
jgi:hypothetical protein